MFCPSGSARSRRLISGDDVEVAGKAGKVQPLSLSMTELVTADNTQILLPNGRVWGAANTRADRILKELAQRLPHRCSGATYRLRHEGPRCRQSRGTDPGIDGQREGETLGGRCCQAVCTRPRECAACGGVSHFSPAASGVWPHAGAASASRGGAGG
ncbi:mechanosensitive ion channel domain-containing protein [Bradyrhizobium nitroreducens]|uniref:mechanosensitive ion channel domain-containing protein n=1 Tax=Bradyrhizobium nitroreducens TaxID=709803 RepID=UPI00322217F0